MNGSPLEAFLLLGVLPLGIMLVITLLMYLPSMMHREKRDPTASFSEESEWVNGPDRSLEEVKAAPAGGEASPGRGGASAQW